MTVLVIDNYDSYTFNLYQLLAAVDEQPPRVLANDDPELLGAAGEVEAIVISPGPGHPGRRRDTGLLDQLLAITTVPMLGVCLGHQAIAHEAGAVVERAPRARHGHLSTVAHRGDPLFAGLPNRFVAVRYHSLAVREPLPAALMPTAWSEDGVLMGLRHRSRPRWGVQFHPESIASEFGRPLTENFLRLARAQSIQHRPLAESRAT